MNRTRAAISAGITIVLIAALTTLLVLLFIHRLTRGNTAVAAFTAMVFALHPMHVESVAWVSERKDVLSTLFWFLTIHAWISWTRTPTVRRRLIDAGGHQLHALCTGEGTPTVVLSYSGETDLTAGRDFTADDATPNQGPQPGAQRGDTNHRLHWRPRGWFRCVRGLLAVLADVRVRRSGRVRVRHVAAKVGRTLTQI